MIGNADTTLVCADGACINLMERTRLNKHGNFSWLSKSPFANLWATGSTCVHLGNEKSHNPTRRANEYRHEKLTRRPGHIHSDFQLVMWKCPAYLQNIMSTFSPDEFYCFQLHDQISPNSWKGFKYSSSIITTKFVRQNQVPGAFANYALKT